MGVARVRESVRQLAMQPHSLRLVDRRVRYLLGHSVFEAEAALDAAEHPSIFERGDEPTGAGPQRGAHADGVALEAHHRERVDRL